MIGDFLDRMVRLMYETPDRKKCISLNSQNYGIIDVIFTKHTNADLIELLVDSTLLYDIMYNPIHNIGILGYHFSYGELEKDIDFYRTKKMIVYENQIIRNVCFRTIYKDINAFDDKIIYVPTFYRNCVIKGSHINSPELYAYENCIFER